MIAAYVVPFRSGAAAAWPGQSWMAERGGQWEAAVPAHPQGGEANHGVARGRTRGWAVEVCVCVCVTGGLSVIDDSFCLFLIPSVVCF